MRFIVPRAFLRIVVQSSLSTTHEKLKVVYFYISYRTKNVQLARVFVI